MFIANLHLMSFFARGLPLCHSDAPQCTGRHKLLIHSPVTESDLPESMYLFPPNLSQGDTK